MFDDVFFVESVAEGVVGGLAVEAFAADLVLAAEIFVEPGEGVYSGASPLFPLRRFGGGGGIPSGVSRLDLFEVGLVELVASLPRT